MILVNGERIDWREGMTIQDVLDACNYVFPLLVVKVNGKLVKKPQYDSHIVHDGDEIKVLHMISGG